MFKRTYWAATLAALAVAAPAHSTGLDYVGECVPFARQISGIQIFGDAWTWWSQAKGRYVRGDRPRVGAVIVFARSPRLRLGHVAVVSRVVSPHVVMVTHANWSRINGERGHAEQDVTMFDVSAAGDWSSVKVWYRDCNKLGTSVYPVSGFVYGTPDPKAAGQRPALASASLTGNHPSDVLALVDAYAR